MFSVHGLHEKAFKSIEFPLLFASLESHGVEPAYISLLWNICNGATAMLRLHQNSKMIKLERGAGRNTRRQLITKVIHIVSTERHLQRYELGKSMGWTSTSIENTLPTLNSLTISSWCCTCHKSWSRHKITCISPAIGLSMHLGKTRSCSTTKSLQQT